MCTVIPGIFPLILDKISNRRTVMVTWNQLFCCPATLHKGSYITDINTVYVAYVCINHLHDTCIHVHTQTDARTHTHTQMCVKGYCSGISTLSLSMDPYLNMWAVSASPSLPVIPYTARKGLAWCSLPCVAIRCYTPSLTPLPSPTPHLTHTHTHTRLFLTQPHLTMSKSFQSILSIKIRQSCQRRLFFSPFTQP